MFQNNTEVAIPFLIRSKNHGILWDNYSLSKIGDAGSFMPLSSLRLYPKEGDPGWLTASYSNDRKKPSDIAFTKSESEISYRYVNSTKDFLPKDFNIQNGVVTWEGSIAPGFSGTHKFNFFYAGYTKLWIDGHLQLGRWRQAWNTGSCLVSLDMEKGKKYAIKIEWIPDGGESYLDVKWLNPILEQDVNTYTFASEAGKKLDYYFVSGSNVDDCYFGVPYPYGQGHHCAKMGNGFLAEPRKIQNTG